MKEATTFSDWSPSGVGKSIEEQDMVALAESPYRINRVKEADRRIFPRKEVHIRVEGRRLDHTLVARRQPQLSLALRDVSLGGMSAISQTPLANGERISVFFPPEGASRGWDAFGRVIRCEVSGMGYRVAMEFDPLPAA